MVAEIQRFVKQRRIRCLVHFTRLSNLGSILQRGLVTRDVLLREGNGCASNDAYRHDHTNAVCVSVGFPNYKMFWGLRQDNPTTEWVILAIAPSALWELPCAFCATNAADARVSTIPLEQRMTFGALQSMYGDFDGKRRADLPLTPDLPTNPQAEILMLHGVPPQYILGVSVQNNAVRAKVEAVDPGVDVRVHPHFYDPRQDFAHWKRNA